MLSPTFSSVLAIVVALASLFLFLISFIAPRLYRAQDLWWSGVGIFYALVLWFCSAQIRGAILLGTIASVSLLGWLSTQVYLSRWALLTDAEKGGGALKQLQALGQKLSRLLESRPSKTSTPSQQATNQTPEASSPKTDTPKTDTPKTDTKAATDAENIGSKNASSKMGKVRWVRPEKPKPPQDAPVQPIADSPLETSNSAEAPEPSTTAPTQPAIVQPSEPIVSSEPQAQPEKAIVSPLAESALVPELQTADEWDDMEADLEDETSVKTPTSPRSEAESEATKTSVVKRIQNFFQGRKSHGKRFVRPEDEPVPAKPTPTPRPEPSPNSSVETAPPELSELSPPAVEAIETLADLTLDTADISEISTISEPSETGNTEEPLPAPAPEVSNVSEDLAAPDPTLEVSPETETPDVVSSEAEISDVVSSEAETPDVASSKAEIPDVVSSKAEIPDVVSSEAETPDVISSEAEAPKDGTPEPIENTNTSPVERVSEG